MWQHGEEQLKNLLFTVLCVIEIALWRQQGDRIWLYSNKREGKNKNE